MVADKLNLKFINYTFRTMAKEKGVSFDELRQMAEESTAIDMELDKKQVYLAIFYYSGILRVIRFLRCPGGGYPAGGELLGGTGGYSGCSYLVAQ